MAKTTDPSVLQASPGVEQLWETGGVRLTRCSPDGRPGSILVVTPIHDHPPASIIQRLEHEYALRAELDPAWALYPLELRLEGGRALLELEDPGGRTLDSVMGTPFQIDAFLRLAVSLTTAVGHAHARGLIHKDMKPTNILVDVAGSVRLTGFGIASRLLREHQAPTPPEIIAGTLAYMAPEQTGRMNRSVDARSDLYSLGVIFYEMLTGKLPFDAADPMEWVHCHIARQPVAPNQRLPAISKQISSIVMKLLTKAADDRYQTAAGLTIDLRRCLAEWNSYGDIEPFPLGARDVPDRLLIPEILYGRDDEIDTLTAAFERVVAHGTMALVLVTGYSGIGKSSVVNELHKSLVPPRGLFASGKFDQYKRDIPYATLAQAFRSLVRPLLSLSEAQLERWRASLREALGLNAQMMVDLVPELALVIGPQTPVAELPLQDAKSRFHRVFGRFLGVFACEEHPLVLFLDDLQWLDTATLDLLEHLVTNADVRYLLLVGAYRNNEVGPNHPLMSALEGIRESAAIVYDIMLTPLKLDDIGRLIPDALHCTPERAWRLAELVHEKTGGNPFFAIQFLTALVDENLITFDRVTSAWVWDTDRVSAASYTDNVVDFMVAKLQRLSPITQKTIKRLACLDSIARIDTLSLVLDNTEETVHAALLEAVHAGLVMSDGTAYKFLHDRIQQAAYSMVPDAQCAEIHLDIARVLLASLTADQLAEQLFEVANQFNRGAELIVGWDERIQVARLSLWAGRKAKAAAAYASARTYFASGIALFDKQQGWGVQHQLIFNLSLESTECELLCGRLENSAQMIVELLEHAVSDVEFADVSCLKINLHVLRGEHGLAIDTALGCLRRFGIDLPAHPNPDQVRAEYDTVRQHLDEDSLESLVDLPMITDPRIQAAMQVLSALAGPATFTDFQLFCLMACRMVKLSIQHGMSGASAYAFATLGSVLGANFHHYREGYRLAKLACDLVEKHAFTAYETKVDHAMGLAAFWTEPLTNVIELRRAATRTAAERGDFTFACYGMHQSITYLLMRNDPLDAVWRESEMALGFARTAKFRDVADLIVSQKNFIASMQRRDVTLSSFSNERFDEAASEAKLIAVGMPTALCLHWIRKLKARYLTGDYAEARAATEKAKALLRISTVQLQLFDYFYYGALTVAALYDEASAEAQSGWRELLTTHREQLREWAESYPPTFSDKHALVSAELARIEGRDSDAMRLYEAAIRTAHEHGFVQNEGVAYEVAALFYAARGFETIASVYLRNASHCYLLWGALGKVRQLERQHPKLLGRALPWATAATGGTSHEQLDIGTLVRAAQAVSGEIVLDRLIDTLMTLALEHAGAGRGLLILLRDDMPQIVAEALTDHKTIEVLCRPAPLAPDKMPETLLRTVLRTRESVILEDAAAPNPFSSDAYFQVEHVRSVLCLPLLKQAELIGLLYLENNLASHAFTPARITVLELLAAQAAISLENARLYADLLRENRERQIAEDAMRVSEARWRSLFENVPIGLAMVGSDKRYIQVNPAFQNMTGYSEAELLTLSPADITHEDDRAETEAILTRRSVAEEPVPIFEKRYRRKDGGIIWVEVNAFFAPISGKAAARAASAVDITDRKRAEAALQRSEAYLTEAQRLSRMGSFAWNIARGVILWSEACFGIYGYDTAPFATREMILQRVHPADYTLVRTILDRASGIGADFDFEHRLLMPDGSVRYLHVVAQAVGDQEDGVEYIGAVMDVTAARLAEESLRKAQADLAHAGRVSALGELAASIAHEINQPLTAIASSGSAGLKWLDRDPPDLDAARRSVARIVQDAHHASDVLRSLRALAVKSGPEVTKLDINNAIQEVLALTRGDLQRHGVTLHTDLSTEIPPVMGDRIQLQQVLLNLIMNGVEAMQSILDRPKLLAITSASVQSGDVLIGVEDTGAGLDSALADRIFLPFYTTKSSGMGMGLSICRTIIESHGGQIWAKPKTPEGAIFQFRLPAVDQEDI